MDFFTALDIVKSLTALSGMISAYLTLRREKEKGGKLLKQEKLDRKEAETILLAGHVTESAVDPKEVEFLQALPRDIGDAAKDKIGRILKRYYTAIKSPISVFELDKESEIAEFEICHTLRLIKKHNNGKLPTKHLRDLWEAFNCDEAIH